jgi:hypothetical protein
VGQTKDARKRKCVEDFPPWEIFTSFFSDALLSFFHFFSLFVLGFLLIVPEFFPSRRWHMMRRRG